MRIRLPGIFAGLATGALLLPLVVACQPSAPSGFALGLAFFLF